MSVIVLTSTFLRHQFLINYLAQHLNVVGVWQEEKSFKPLSYAENPSDQDVIRKHFSARDKAEQVYFGQHANLQINEETFHRCVTPGKINDPIEVRYMENLCPDLILVFGTGILKEIVISPFKGRILNIHLGLSPYYRGSGTNFWPLVNREPEYVGATIHYLDAGIDTGPIISHVRPEMEPSDGPHDLGNKTILAAADQLALIATEIIKSGPIPGKMQTDQGKLYQRKDFNADKVRQLYENFRTGMIAEYLDNKRDRDAYLNLLIWEAS